jgi:predicted HAD superfamily Cof-like phosphohydrolase
MTMFDDVGAFHKKFGLDVYHEDTDAHWLSDELMEFRLKFLEEEMRELREAVVARDMVKVADALGDIVWVALGHGHLMSIPMDGVWAEIRRANMAKVRSVGDDDPRSTRGSRFDVVKPPGWVPPDIGWILKR